MTAKILAAIAATAAAAAVTAQGNEGLRSYQFEIAGGLTFTEIDANPDIESTTLAAVGEYHFEPVRLGDHPWNEAAFLEHSMSLMAGLDYTTLEIASFDADGPGFSAGYRYARPDEPIAAEVRFSSRSLDGDRGVDVDQTTFGARVGYWLQPNAIVGALVDTDEFEIGTSERTKTRFGGFGKIVHDLGEQCAVNAEAHAGFVNVDDNARDDTNFELGVAGDYYFTPQHSAGALLDFSFGDADSEEGVRFGVRGSAWLTPQVAVNGRLTVFSASDNAGNDSTEFGAFVVVRF